MRKVKGIPVFWGMREYLRYGGMLPVPEAYASKVVVINDRLRKGNGFRYTLLVVGERAVGSFALFADALDVATIFEEQGRI